MSNIQHRALPIADAATSLHISKVTLKRMMADGTIRYSKWGKRLFISTQSISEFLGDS